MPSKADLEDKITELQNQIDGLIAERGIFYTDLLKLAYQHKLKVLIEFLNPTPEEIIEIKNDLAENGLLLVQDYELSEIYDRLAWCEKCNGYLPLMTKLHYACPNCNTIIGANCWNCDWRKKQGNENICSYKNCNMGKYVYYEKQADIHSFETISGDKIKVCDWIPIKQVQVKNDQKNKRTEKPKAKTKSILKY